jgi:hypothetical protein
MKRTCDLSLFSSKCLETRDYLLLPRLMRRKIIKDLSYSRNPDLETLREFFMHEEDPGLKSLIQHCLSKWSEERWETRFDDSMARNLQVLRLLMSKDRDVRRKAFRYAAQNPSSRWIPAMNRVVSRDRDPFLKACLARNLTFSGPRRTREFLSLLQNSNSLILKIVLEGLEKQNCLEAREIFLTVLRLPLLKSAAAYHLCTSAIHRIPVHTRELCWAQALAGISDDPALEANLRGLCDEFPELAKWLNGDSGIVQPDQSVEYFLNQLAEDGYVPNRTDLPKLREIIKSNQNPSTLRKAISELLKFTEGNEWDTLSQHLTHKDPTLRFEALKALIQLKDKRIKPQLMNLLRDPEAPLGQKLSLAESGFSLLIALDESFAVSFLNWLLDCGPNAAKTLKIGLQNWESPSIIGLRTFLDPLETRQIKPYHRPILFQFFVAHKTQIKKLRLEGAMASIGSKYPLTPGSCTSEQVEKITKEGQNFSKVSQILNVLVTGIVQKFGKWLQNPLPEC